LVRSSIEETLNALLDKEANKLVNTGKYERTNERMGNRSGYHTKQLTTTAGDVKLKVPRLKGIPFETQMLMFCRRGPYRNVSG